MTWHENFDFGKFVQRIYINRNPNDVFKMLVTPELIESWYVRSSQYHTQDGRLKSNNEELIGGDEYEWTWTDGAKLRGLILECRQDEHIKFTFGNDVIVTINLNQSGARTLVELTQEQNMNDDENKFNNYMACFPGWEFYLINLKSVCEGGIDLRESNPDTEFLVNI